MSTNKASFAARPFDIKEVIIDWLAKTMDDYPWRSGCFVQFHYLRKCQLVVIWLIFIEHYVRRLQYKTKMADFSNFLNHNLMIICIVMCMWHHEAAARNPAPTHSWDDWAGARRAVLGFELVLPGIMRPFSYPPKLRASLWHTRLSVQWWHWWLIYILNKLSHSIFHIILFESIML